MPAVFGALTNERGDVDFDRDLGALRIFPEQRVDLHDLGALRVASVERPGAPARLATCAETGAVLHLKGILDVETGAPPRDGAIQGDPEAAWVLARIRRSGREAAVGLPGHYVAILWEPREERLSLMVDLLGLYPVYHATLGTTFLFGTQTRPFERARGFRREPDPAAVLELLRAEYLLGERSMVRGASLVPAGSLLEVRRGGRPEVRRVRDPFRERGAAPGTIDEAAALLGRAYDAAFSRGMLEDGPLVVPLSGGKDSRVVLCETLRACPGAAGRTRTISLGAPEHWDVRCARRVARALGLPWRLVPFDPTLHDRWLERYIDLMDGTSSIFATWWAAILEQIDDPATGVACGFLGDSLSGAHFFFFEPFDGMGRRARFDPGVEFLLARLGQRCWSRDALARTLRPEIAGEWLDGPARTLRESHFELEGAPRHVRMVRTDVIHRQRRFIASQLHLYRQRHRVAAPFADPAVVGAFLSFNEEHLRGQRAYARALALRHPRAAAVMESHTRRPVAGRVIDSVRCRAETAFVAVRDRVRSKLLRAEWPEREFFSFRHVYRDEIAADLAPLDRFFDPDALRTELTREAPDSNRVRLLYTLRGWLRTLDGSCAGTPRSGAMP
jgi:asparagine synthetase B (glutamine-hydrolysing)